VLTPSLLSDATHSMKRYEAGGDTHGAEVGCNYYDSTKNYNYGWTLYYLFKTDTAAEVAQELAGGYAPLGGWAHPAASYCGVSKTVYAYVSCNTTDPETVADAKAMLAAAEGMAAPQAQATTTTTSPKGATRTAVVTKFSGDVQFSTDGGKTFAPLTSSTVLHNGDFVATGLRSRVTLAFGPDTLTIEPITQFRIDEYTNANNIARTRTFLRVGSIEAKVRHTNAIRSDFSVTAPTCNVSIRGSGMVVSTSKSGTTSIYTTSDVSYVKGLADTKTLALRNGYMTIVGANRKATKPVHYAAAALKKITG
jgi:hypothetical protein